MGFTLNGIGEWKGKLTSYDTGTGIIKEYRKKGIATKMFNDSLPLLRENNIHQYLLEVIRTNTSAFDLYEKSGFEVIREFDYYVSRKDLLKINDVALNSKFKVREVSAPDWDLLKTFWDFEPSWQNSINSINRKINYFKILGIFVNSDIVGYGVIEKTTGDIPQLAIDKKYRRIGLATAIFNNLIILSEVDEIKIINTDAGYEPFKKFTESINLKPEFGQYEMILNF